ncbi:unnamed protein product [Soboliphyme baturini]|uniref:GRIP domain-containing protein n=1 Tax=Soboliphyme baturini TaxID=241478 RepID=A0A183IUM9_9BILA|nr:unnamed protein product [Soboliphyme baturini]
MECLKNKLSSTIQDLQSELKSLKNKVTFLENERQNLESQSQTQSQLQNSQLKALEMVLENVSKEKEAISENYQQQMEEERIAAEEREFTLKKEYTTKLFELERQNKTFQENMENRGRAETEQLREVKININNEPSRKPLMQQQQLSYGMTNVIPEVATCELRCGRYRELLAANQEALCQLSKENATLVEEVQLLKQKIAENEENAKKVEILTAEVSEKELCLCDAQATIEALQQRIVEFQQNCDDQQILIKDFRENMMNLPAEMEAGLERTKFDSGTSMSSSTESKLLEEVDKRIREEQEKWLAERDAKIETVRQEVKSEFKIEMENLNTQLEAKRSLINDLRSKNDAAMQHQEELCAQLSAFSEELDRSDTVRKQYENVLGQLHEEKEKKKKLVDEFKECRSTINELINKQKTEIEELTLVVDAQRQKLSEIEPLEQKLNRRHDHKSRKDVNMRYYLELKSEHANCVHHEKLCKELQFDAYREELRSMEEKIGRMDDECQAEVQSLRTEVHKKDQQLCELNHKVYALTSTLDEVNKELDLKMQEILNVRNETHEYIRRREQQQTKSHMRDIDNIRQDYEAKLRKQSSADNDQSQELKVSLAKAAESSDASETVEKFLTAESKSVKGTNWDDAMHAKRVSLSSACSERTPHNICRKANMSVICKWQNLVNQVTSDQAVQTRGQGHGTKPKSTPSQPKGATPPDAKDKASLTQSTMESIKDGGQFKR